MLGAICGRARAGEQALLARLVRRRPDLFAGRVVCFDRNFPGYDLITAILQAGGHVVARVKEGISLPLEPGGLSALCLVGRFADFSARRTIYSASP
jgi:hypothetical protein